MFAGITGVEMVHIPYQSIGQILPDLITGRVHIMFNATAPMILLVKEGRLQAMGITGARRVAASADTPTLAESGLSGMDLSPWYAFYAAAGTPQAIINRLNFEIEKIMNSTEFRERYSLLGLEVITSPSEQLAKRARKDCVRYENIFGLSDQN
jgi:tripartite-type tricarboxylate transporter receptor subunit TctC